MQAWVNRRDEGLTCHEGYGGGATCENLGKVKVGGAYYTFFMPEHAKGVITIYRIYSTNILHDSVNVMVGSVRERPMAE